MPAEVSGERCPATADVLAIGQIFLALAQAHEVSLAELIQLTTTALLAAEAETMP